MKLRLQEGGYGMRLAAHDAPIICGSMVANSFAKAVNIPSGESLKCEKPRAFRRIAKSTTLPLAKSAAI